MYITKLSTHNFRNIKSPELTFTPGINVLYGANAAGKTNAVEAINMFSTGKSIRGSAEREFITKGEKEARISLEFVRENGSARRENKLECLFYDGDKKEMLENGIQVRRMSDFIGNFLACSFTPDDVALVKGSPEERRRFLDIVLCQLSKKYTGALQRYQTKLGEKSAYLKLVLQKFGGKYDEGYFGVLNDFMSFEMGDIVKQRYELCRRLGEKAGAYYHEITGRSEKLAIRYVSQSGERYDDVKFTGAKYREIFEAGIGNEVRARKILYGIQRDEVHFYFVKDGDYEEFALLPEDGSGQELICENGMSARYFGSRGQQRSVVLALKLAQSDIIYEKTGEYPVLLLDDVFSELDARHREYLLSKMKDRQVIITCCDCDVMGVCRDFRAIHVDDGHYTGTPI